MSTIVLGEAVAGMFCHGVVPVLEARGIACGGPPLSHLQQLLNDRPRWWTVGMRRPKPGAICRVQFLGRAAPKIYDSRICVFGQAENLQGDQIVQVRSAFGISALCEPTEGIPPEENTFESSVLLAISSRDVTLLLDVLPDKDCWIAVAVWANEKLPMDILLQRPEKLWSASTATADIVILGREETTFATQCAECDGVGEFYCEDCHASGLLPCIRCESRGGIKCSSCQGSGVLKPPKTCPNCRGSGKYGDAMSPCGYCQGNGGWPQVDCRDCRQSGERLCPNCNGEAQVPCSPCAGTGSFDCRRCRASGFLHVHFSTLDGHFTGSAQDDAGNRIHPIVRPGNVCVFSWENNEEVSINSGAAQLLQHVTEATRGRGSCEPVVAARLEEHCRQFQAIEGCLMRSLETNGILEISPIHLGRPEASLSRSRDGVAYEFPVVREKQKAWLRDGLLPFPQGSPVQLCTKDEEKRVTPIELPLQGKPSINAKHVATLVGCHGREISYRLVICFPAQIDIAKLPRVLILKPDSPPPPEKTQLKHLRQWCSAENRDHPVLQSLVLAEESSPIRRPQRLFNPGIAKFPRQADAVGLALAATPLGLIKGPPGSGKTTVITEIVRQLAKLGQRVLICSQTHQAVRNVLEGLHKLGGFRMIRHGREDNLSEIEKSYLGGGAEDAYFHNVVGHSRRALEALRQQILSLDQALQALPSAQHAAQRLGLVRQQAAQQIAVFEGQAASEMREADGLLSQQLTDAKAAERNQLANLELLHRNIEPDLVAIRAKLTKAERQRVATENGFQKRTRRQPEVIRVEPTWWRRIRDAFLPNWLVRHEVLQERYSVAVQQIAELVPREQAFDTQLADIATDEAKTRKHRADSEQRCRADHASLRTIAELQLTRQCGEIREKAHDEEQQLRLIQATSASLAGTLVSGLSDDAPPDVWLAAITGMTADRQSAAARHAFVLGWVKEIEAEPRDVFACYWDHLQVFFSTCVGVGSWRQLVARGRAAVDLVIIDEAAHATATETLIPLLYSKRALLIGDEMQLPPLLPNNIRECSEDCSQLVRRAVPANCEPTRGIAGEVRMTPCWLGCSFFEWIWRACPGVSRTMLDTQFRMHPSIAAFVGKVFYPEGLVTGVAAQDRELAFGEFSRPVCLISTSAYENRHEEYLEPGYRILLEAQTVRRVVEKAEAELKDPQEFGVITPYAEQKRLIVRELAELLPDLRKVRLTPDDVASVDSFQGSERDVIIVSFARSPKPCQRCQGSGSRGQRKCDDCQGKGWRGTGLTFARDLRRLNVAFSRARKMLILIGDISALTDPRYRGGAPGGKVLDLFREYVADRGKVLHLWERTDACE